MRKIVAVMLTGSVDSEAGLMAINKFVKDAVETWGGQLPPTHPLFESLADVKVKTIHVANLGE